MAKDGHKVDGRGWSRWRIIGWGGAALLLLLPLVANAPWTPFDFIFMGFLLGGVGLGLELAVRKGNLAYSIAAGVALAAAFLLIWVNAAVGIIGSEDEEGNLLFAAVLAVALLGSVATLFRPAGMVWAMAAAGATQALVPLVAALIWPGSMRSIGAPEVIVLSGFFTGMWLLSAWLFRKAGRDRTGRGAASSS